MVGRVSLLALAGLGLAFGPAAFADESHNDASAPASQPAAVHKKPVNPNLDDDAVICRREEATGTRLGATKICHKRSEWTAISNSARTQVDTWQDQANATMPH